MRNLASSLRPSRAKMRGGAKLGRGGARFKAGVASLSTITFSHFDILRYSGWCLLSLQFGTLAKFCGKLGQSYKISQHFATLDSVRRQPGWPRRLLAARDNIPKFNLQFCQEQEHSDNRGEGDDAYLDPVMPVTLLSTQFAFFPPSLAQQVQCFISLIIAVRPFNHSRVSRTSYTTPFLLKLLLADSKSHVVKWL